MKPNLDVSIAFLKVWLPKGPWCLAAIHPDHRDKKDYLKSAVFSGPKDEKKAREWLEKHGEYNLYYTANRAKVDQNVKRPTRDDLVEMLCLHADIDPRAGEDLEAEQLRIKTLLLSPRPKDLPPPTFVIFTGGGFQALWKLNTPVPINDGAHADDLSRYNLQVRNQLDGDSAQDLSRILRLPGSINWPSALKKKKGRVAAVAEIVKHSPENVYELKDFIQAPALQVADSAKRSTRKKNRRQVEIGGNIRRLDDVNELPENVPGTCKVVIVQGHNPENSAQFAGDRSKAVWYVVCELVRCKVPDDVIFSVLTDPGFGISAHVLEQPRPDRYVTRQIARAHEYAIDPDLLELNERFAVVTNFGGKCRVIEEVYDERLRRATLTTLTFEDLRNAYLNQQKQIGEDDFMPLAEWWLRNANRRQYERIVFQPNADEEVDGCYNLWRGFGVEPIPGDCGLFLDHVRHVLCGGDEACYMYVLKWMARAVQMPAEPGQVALVLKGRMGTGKSFFARTLGRLFGRHYLAVSDSKRLISNFNSHLRDCVLLFADEAFYAGDKKHESILKALITEDTLAIEAKGKDIEMGSNCLHVVMASNDDWAVPASMDDRRFFVLDVKDDQRNAHGHFAKMQEQLDSGGYSALLHTLLTLDISNFNVRSRPDTAALSSEKVMSLGPVEAYWYECLRNGSLGLIGSRNDKWPDVVPKGQVFDEIRRRGGTNFRLSNVALGILFAKKLLPPTEREHRIPGQSVWKDHQGNERVTTNAPGFELPPLAKCREWWVKRFGPPADPWPSESGAPTTKKVPDNLPF